MFKVKDEWKTVRAIVRNRYSISRYGDGEFKNACYRSCKPQIKNKNLAHRLQQILQSSNNECLIAIPNIYDRLLMSPDAKGYEFWKDIRHRKSFNRFIDPNKQYYSSFITRPDNAPSINCREYWDLFKQMWEGRELVLVKGRDFKFCKNPEFFDNAVIVDEIHGPMVNAYNDYEQILQKCLRQPKDRLFLLRLGPCATVLAYDLSMNGYQALDLGHAPMFYNRFVNKSKEIDYNNTITSKDVI